MTKITINVIPTYSKRNSIQINKVQDTRQTLPYYISRGYKNKNAPPLHYP